MDSINFSIVPMDGNESFKKYNAGDWYWVSINFQRDEPLQVGSTMIGPCRLTDARKYLDRQLYPKKKGFWNRLFGK